MAIRNDFAPGEVLAAADLNDTLGSKLNATQGTATDFIRIVRSNNSGFLSLRRNNAGSAVVSGDQIGLVSFGAFDGSDYQSAAQIIGAAEANAAANDTPGFLLFATTPAASTTPLERMRISSAGRVGIGVNPAGSTRLHNSTSVDENVVRSDNSNAAFSNSVYLANATRAANAAYQFFTGWSGDFADVEFNLRGDGNGLCDGAWTGGGADYAEYFEWLDGNPDSEDRRGIAVTLDGDKIKPAEQGDTIIGVISGNPSVVGDAAWNKWNGKYLRDDFGSYALNEDGERTPNPDYDADVVYVSREDRPEWDCVGLMGKLRVRKGQPTDSRWIKMRDVSEAVEEWLVR
jgi:hypothetical protein